MNEASESKCLRCGRCCEYKCRDEVGRVHLTGNRCYYFDEKTKTCLIYADRFTLNPGCMHIEDMIKLGLLPKTCGYVKDLPGYHPVVEEYCI